MDEDAAGGGATLAGGADGAEQNGARGQVQVGRGGDDDGVVAAQFEQRAAQAALTTFADVAAHVGRAGGGDERQALVVGQSFADASRPPMARLKMAGSTPLSRQTRSAILMVAMAQSGVWLGRFPEGGVAADGGQRAVPGPDGDGEIEGGDDADDAQRMPLLHHAVAAGRSEAMVRP